MPGLIPENILEDILSRINIVEIISEYLPLKRAGRNFKATCPFHHEKTPSFMVSPDRQIYHCFGCGESGNAFKFLMRYERLDFPEAVEILARKAGVVLPQVKREDVQAVSVGTQLYKINELALGFYQSVLQSTAGAQAKDYLLKRDIKEESIKSLGLGFAADKWDGLMNFLRAKGIGLSLLEKAGLILPRDNGGYYDRFRQRVMFPIFDIKSRIIGFGGRILIQTDKNQAKYVNSPETPIYTKGRNLYGLNLAKEAIRQADAVVVVEGYLDFMLPYQEGVQNIVASLGTALTEEQARLIKRYTHNVVMVYDADDAGQMATLRSLDIFIEEGMNVRVASLPPGIDPDLFVRKNGIDNFKQLVASADDLFDYKLKILKSQYQAGQIQGKAKICAEMLPTIGRFKNEILKSEYIKKLAEKLHLEEDALLQELAKLGTKDNKPVSAAPTRKSSWAVNPTEKLLIKLMLAENELIEQIRQHLEPADFQDERTAKIVSLMFDLSGQGKAVEPNKLMNHLDDATSLEFICESVFNSEVSPENKEKVVSDCIRLLKNKRVFIARQRMQEEIKAAEDIGDQEQLGRLKEEFCNLIKRSK